MRIHYEDADGRKYTIACVEEEMRLAAGDGELYPEAIAGVFGWHHGLHGKGRIKDGSVRVEFEEGDESYDASR